MAFLHIFILPLIIFLFSLFLQKWFDKDEFYYFFLIFFVGLLAGIVFSIILGIVDSFYIGTANHFSIFFKSLIFNGIIFTIFIFFTFHLTLDFFLDMSIKLDWSNTTIYSFSFLSGIFTVIHFFQAISKESPANPLVYFSFIPLLIIVSIIIGFGLPKFLNSYYLNDKIKWASLILGITSISLTVYFYLKFYDYLYQYLLLLVSGAFIYYFEKLEFKKFRNKIIF